MSSATSRIVQTLSFGLIALAASAEQQGSASARSEDEPVVEQRDVLFVEESLPFLPASNTVLTKLPTETAWTPANVGLVDLTTIDEQGAEILGDALENVSGVNVHTGNGIFDFFVLRGFDSLSSGLVLTDGAPEPEATFYQLYNAERIEVFKGPAGFLYGSNPLAGVVNLVRKQPVPADFGSLSMSYGSWQESAARVDLNRSSAEGVLSFRVNGLYRRGDGHRDGRDHRVAGVNPALTWRPSDVTAVHVNLEALSSDYTPDAGLPLVDGRLPSGVPRSRSYASPFDFSEQDLVRFQVDVESQLTPSLAVRSKTYARSLDWQTDGTLLGGVFPGFAQPVVARSLLLLDDRQDFLGSQLELVISAETGGIEHRVLAGLEVARFSDEYALDVALLPTIGLLDPVETARPPLFQLPGQSARGDARSDVVAPYVVDQMRLSDRFQVLAGLRYDAIDFDDRLTGASRSDGELSPMLGVVYKPRPDLALYANVARSFAPPSARVVGDRRPEESRQLEVGLRNELLGDRLRSTLALFELERDNIAIPDDNGFTQQTGDQRARGLEAEIGARLARDVDFSLAYAYTDSELTRFTELVFVPGPEPMAFTADRSGNNSAFAPKHLLNFWLSRRAGAWTLGGGLRWVDEQFIAEDNVTAIDAYLLMDAAISRAFGDWRLRLAVDNLTDEEFETRGFGTSAVIPGRPFAARLEIEYRL